MIVEAFIRIIRTIIVPIIQFILKGLRDLVGGEFITPEDIGVFFSTIGSAVFLIPLDVVLVILSVGVLWLVYQLRIAVAKLVIKILTAGQVNL